MSKAVRDGQTTRGKLDQQIAEAEARAVKLKKLNQRLLQQQCNTRDSLELEERAKVRRTTWHLTDTHIRTHAHTQHTHTHT